MSADEVGGMKEFASCDKVLLIADALTLPGLHVNVSDTVLASKTCFRELLEPEFQDSLVNVCRNEVGTV